jgi:hypothetical protein
MKAKHILIFAALALAAAFSGCAHPIVNLTGPQVRENPSRIYTLTMNAREQDQEMVAGSLQAFIVIEGEEHEMSLLPYGDLMFEYEYAMPADRSEAKYYYILRWDDTTKSGMIAHREEKAPDIYTLDVVNHYVLGLQSSRGLVGSVIPVMGNNFRPTDHVVIGGKTAATTYASPNALTFVVPPLAPSENYDVELHSGSDVFPVDTFHVDIAQLTVAPAGIELNSGEFTQLVFTISETAPDGGLPIDVLTDVPASVVMPEVVVPAGQSSVSVKVQGGQVGAGTLHISPLGFNSVLVPIKVNPAVFVPAPTPAPAPAPIPEPAPAAAAPATPATTGDIPAAAVLPTVRGS